MSLDNLISLTGKRRESFSLMIDSLKNKNNPLIIETGCSRIVNNFAGDGMSTVIFDAFIKEYGGLFYSVDINENNVNTAKNLTTCANIFCSDSVQFLHSLNLDLKQNNKKIDLLYLDSFDFDMNNPHPSSMHHIMELLAIWQSCDVGTIIAVDDNFENGLGKGKYVRQFMSNIGIEPIYNGYQIVWKL